MFGSYDKVSEEAKEWLRVQNSSWHKKGVVALFYRWHKAFEVYGDYVEKWDV
jgi:hypothetical protein